MNQKQPRSAITSETAPEAIQPLELHADGIPVPWGVLTPDKTSAAQAGTVFTQLVTIAFQTARKPPGFDDLLADVIERCEPKAAAQFAPLVLLQNYVGPRCVGDSVDLIRGSLFGRKVDRAAREFVTSLARVADGLESFDDAGEVSR